MPTGHSAAVLLALVVALIYLIIVRFVDVNEREPVWAVVTTFVLGACAAGGVRLLTFGPSLALHPWWNAAVVEVSKFVALLISLAIFAGVARLRGWSELTDVVDGMIYGIAVGLGFSAGDTLAREVTTAHLGALRAIVSPGQALLGSALSGLSHGVFGGVIGLGFGAAMGAQNRGLRLLIPLLGLVGAVGLDALLFLLAHGNALGGQAGLVRAWLAVTIPLVALVVVGLYSLASERRAIHSELSSELQVGRISADDLALLQGLWRRQLRYLGLFLTGHVRQALNLAALHNRQVALAVLKRRAARYQGSPLGEKLHRQVDALRGAVAHARTLATVLVLAAVTVFGPVRTSQEAHATQVRERSTDELLLRLAAPDIDAFWGRRLPGYRRPDYVGPYPATSPCPAIPNNAIYCIPARSVFYDPQFLDHQHRTVGDFAAVFILAHEWGHAIEDLRGLMSSRSGRLSIQLELQADCYAGWYTRDARERRLLDPGDDEEAVISLRRHADNLDKPWFDDQAHGNSGQRINAYDYGLNGRDCEGPGLWTHVGVDARASRTSSPPSHGSLSATLPCRQGRFNRVSVEPYPRGIGGNVTDAIHAVFRSPDGIAIDFLRFATVSAQLAEQMLANLTLDGYQVTNEGSVVDDQQRVVGHWRMFTGNTEIIFKSDHQMLDAMEGPTGSAWEFVSGQVYDCSR